MPANAAAGPISRPCSVASGRPVAIEHAGGEIFYSGDDAEPNYNTHQHLRRFLVHRRYANYAVSFTLCSDEASVAGSRRARNCDPDRVPQAPNDGTAWCPQASSELNAAREAADSGANAEKLVQDHTRTRGLVWSIPVKPVMEFSRLFCSPSLGST